MPKINGGIAYLGIDPGASGGLCLLGKWVTPMESSYKDLYSMLGQVADLGEVFCIIEKVWGHIGGPGQPGSAMFKFGQGYGALLMALTAASIPFEEIAPQTWQKGLKIPGRKRSENRSAWKNRLKAHAEKLFPRVEGITLKTCDALLIAEFARRYREGLLNA